MNMLFNYIILTLIAIMYAPIFFKLYSVRWDLLDYSHAYFILPISLWLIWGKREQVKQLSLILVPGRKIFGLILILIGIIMFIFGSRFDYMSITVSSLIPLILGLLYFLYGFEMLNLLSFPILYLLLLVPPPMGILDNITLPMRYVISGLAEKILSILQYSISREGLMLTIGYTDIFMGEPCSGFRSLITLLSLGIVYVYLSKSSLLNKFILTASIVPLALLGNLVRVMVLCLITFYFGEEAGQGFFHNFSGIVMFIITVLGLITIESFMNRLTSITK